VPTLPILEQAWELWPRLTVEVLDEASLQTGRPVFLDYFTSVGGLGVPADAQGVFTVGAADAMGRLQPYTTGGPPLNRDLLVKPDVLVFDGLRLSLTGTAVIYGSNLVTPLAAGMTATVLSARTPWQQWACYLQLQTRRLLRLP
jgi:hypothetical protein